MRNLKIHLAKATNILCFGPDGIEFHFEDYGNVVLVKGTNYDNPGTDDDDRSNATGKSSIPEILSIGFYGRTIKKPTKLKGGDIINTLADKGEIVLEWDDYRLVRTLKKTASGTTSKIDIWESPDHIWDDSCKITRGTSRETQKWIEDKLGLTHHAFCSIVIFDDSDKYQFLEMDGPEKREFVENLLGLDVFRDYHKNAKGLLSQQKQLIEQLAREYNSLNDDVDAVDRRLVTVKTQENDWRARVQREATQLLERVNQKQQRLQSTDAGRLLQEWQTAQDRIGTLTTEITELEARRAHFQEVVNDFRMKMDGVRTHRDAINGSLQEHQLALQTAQQKLQEHLALISQLESLTDGAKCPTCHGTISKNNYGQVLRHAQSSAEECRTASDLHSRTMEVKRDEFGQKSASLSLMENKIRQAEQIYTEKEQEIGQKRLEISRLSNLPKPDSNAEERVLESEIAELKKQLKVKTEEAEGDSPYKEIIEQGQQEKVQKKKDAEAKAKELEAAEKELPYLSFWVNAFAEKGIRKYVVDGIIPALNARIAYWLQFLIDSRIELTFDNELEETVTRNGNPANYHGSSKGEGRRVNLSVSQAFAYVMMLNSGACPSLVFLDEITGGSVDRAGIVGIYNMIFELAKERQVFVTTHDENLLSMLQGCELIRLEKRNDITRLVS